MTILNLGDVFFMKKLSKKMLSLSLTLFLAFMLIPSVNTYASPAPPLTNLQFEYASTDTLVSQGWLKLYDISTGQNVISSDYPLSGTTLKLAIFRYGYGYPFNIYSQIGECSFTDDSNLKTQYFTNSLNEVYAFRDFVNIPLSSLRQGINKLTVTSRSLIGGNTLKDTIELTIAGNNITVSRAANDSKNNLVKILSK